MLPDEYSPDELLRHHVLRAVEGYLELGMVDAAAEELDAVNPHHSPHPEVREVLLSLQMRQEKWAAAVTTGRLLCRECPDEALPFIQTAYCLHELGETGEALRTLRQGPETLQEDAVYHYNAACYLAVLGHMKEAKSSLQTAMALDESLREYADTDPDLAALRNNW